MCSATVTALLGYGTWVQSSFTALTNTLHSLRYCTKTHTLARTQLPTHPAFYHTWHSLRYCTHPHKHPPFDHIQCSFRYCSHAHTHPKTHLSSIRSHTVFAQDSAHAPPYPFTHTHTPHPPSPNPFTRTHSHTLTHLPRSYCLSFCSMDFCTGTGIRGNSVEYHSSLVSHCRNMSPILMLCPPPAFTSISCNINANTSTSTLTNAQDNQICLSG
jgi:hypothetical protein